MRRQPTYREPPSGFWASFLITCVVIVAGVGVVNWRDQHQFNLPAIPFPRIGIAITPAATPVTTARYWQTGVLAGGDATNATAMQTTIRTVQPNHIASQSTDYFWIGSYLADGSFIQVGYAVPWFDPEPRWFFCTFDPQGNEGPCPLGPPGSAGPSGAVHTYTLVAQPADQAGTWDWVASMDGQTIGDATLGAGDTGRQTPSIFVEQSSFAPLSATNDLGPVDFNPAIQFSHDTNGSPDFSAPQHARPAYSSSSACPPFGVNVIASNAVQLGSQLSCLPTDTNLW